MAFQFMALDETKSETKVHGNIYLFDLFFILIYFSISAILGSGVSSALRVPYYIFSVICALWLTSKSSTNKRRRNYESMILFLRRDRTVYRVEKNISMSTEESEAEHERQE